MIVSLILLIPNMFVHLQKRIVQMMGPNARLGVLPPVGLQSGSKPST